MTPSEVSVAMAVLLLEQLVGMMGFHLRLLLLAMLHRDECRGVLHMIGVPIQIVVMLDVRIQDQFTLSSAYSSSISAY
jgi:hypothetical protein